MTKTPLVMAVCRQQKQHCIVYLGAALCCQHDYSKYQRDPLVAWRRGVR